MPPNYVEKTFPTYTQILYYIFLYKINQNYKIFLENLWNIFTMAIIKKSKHLIIIKKSLSVCDISEFNDIFN